MNHDQSIEFLRNIVAIPSESRTEGAVASYMAHELQTFGFETRIDDAGNLIAEKGQGPLLGILLGHIDTVPGQIPVRIENGILHGRGSVDAKGSMATFCAAMARVDSEQLPGRVVIIGCVEEEVPSSKGAHFVVDKYRPEWCVIGEPSGWDSVTLGYKGHLMVEASVDQDRQHGAHEADTAAETLHQFWHEVRAFGDNFNESRQRLYDQLMIRLIAMTGGPNANSEDRGTLKIQCRLPEDMSPDAVQDLMRQHAKPRGIQLQFEGGVEAWSGPRTTPLHRNFLGAIRRQGGRARCLRKTGTADLNIVAPQWSCPALAYGPGDAALDHAPNEHLHIKEYLAAIDILHEVICRQVGLEAPTVASSHQGSRG